MFTLQSESTGPEVTTLQQRLAERGFNPGGIDGIFGPATEAALIAYQRSEGLLADGIAGQRTLSALGLTTQVSLPSALPNVTPLIVSKMFPLTPVKNIRNNLPHVLKALDDAGIGDKPMVLMALATIRAET